MRKMRNHFDHKKRRKAILAGIGLLFGCFILFFYGNDSEGVETYDEYLKAVKKPYQALYTQLQALPEDPWEEEVYKIYHQFEIDIYKVKVSNHAEKIVKENYRQLSTLPETLKEDYNSSSYKYSTVIGQANHAELMVEYIKKNQK